MDLVQNCITAMASQIRILLDVSVLKDCLKLVIADNGKGMSKEFVEKVTSPFTTTRTTRRVGLGIPLLQAGCESAGGTCTIESELGVGTVITGSYQLSHLDRPPLGDFVGIVHNLIVCNPTIDFKIEMKSDTGEVILDTAEVKQQLGGVPVNDPDVSIWIKEYLEEGMAEVNISA